MTVRSSSGSARGETPYVRPDLSAMRDAIRARQKADQYRDYYALDRRSRHLVGIVKHAFLACYWAGYAAAAERAL